jgi:3-methyladenine DNA glycosylase AlkC
MAVSAVEAPVKSPQDKKLYRRLRLSNGLDVLLVSDPEMQASAEDAHGDDEGHDEEEVLCMPHALFQLLIGCQRLLAWPYGCWLAGH